MEYVDIDLQMVYVLISYQVCLLYLQLTSNAHNLTMDGWIFIIIIMVCEKIFRHYLPMVLC